MEYLVNFGGSIADLIVEADSEEAARTIARSRLLSIVEGAGDDEWEIEEAPAE